MLMNVPLQVTAQLGRCTMRIADALQLSAGSVLELDRPTGEPVDLCIGNKLIARGEIVAVEGRYGVLVSDVVA